MKFILKNKLLLFSHDILKDLLKDTEKMIKIKSDL